MLKLLSITLIYLTLCFQVTNAQTITQPYDYPIKRHSAAWDSLKTYEDLRKVCQIPVEIVNQMTTEALFESLLNYPLIGDAFVFTTFKEGMENLKNNFSAFEILINRDDFGKILINKYKSLSIKKLDNESAFNKGEHSVKLSLIELTSVQGTSQSISNSEIITFINILISNYDTKKLNPQIYGTMSLSTCAWAINKLMILNKANDKFIIKDKFVSDGNTFSRQILDDILNQAKLYIKSQSN